MAEDGFLQKELASKMRATFQERLSGTTESGVLVPERFVWDVWHVPKQWSLLRTPAADYFGQDTEEDDFTPFLEELTRYGQRELGCNAISPVWLSLYTDGAFQGLHTDAWQGPFAFVYSLTDWERRGFDGGETVILGDEVLDHWRDFDAAESAEERLLTDEVEPHFNRLTVFDPSYPHYVRQLKGSRDPLRGRLVLHGWFTDPVPFFDGPLEEEAASEGLSAALDDYLTTLTDSGRVFGLFVVRIVVGEDGTVTAVTVLKDALKVDPAVGGEDLQADIRAKLPALLENATFPQADGPTEITLPFVFE